MPLLITTFDDFEPPFVDYQSSPNHFDRIFIENKITMKMLLASAICFGLVCAVYSCSNSTGASATASGKQSSNDPDQVADGKWSATIDGQPPVAKKATTNISNTL